jgi:hypothetical protein
MGPVPTVPLPPDASLPVAIAVATLTALGAYYRRRRRRDRDVEPDAPPAPLTHDTDADRVAQVTITTSQALQSRAGTAPATSIARQLHAALTRAGLPHRITVVNATVTPPAEGTVGSGTPHWWADHGAAALQDAGVPVGDANLLLVDQVGGGGTLQRWLTVGAGGIDEPLRTAPRREGEAGASIFAALHEVGHAFGLAHDLDKSTAGKQHTGRGWNADDRWHLTPMNVDHGVTNACGRVVPTREFDEEVWELFYDSCTVSRWDPFVHRDRT